MIEALVFDMDGLLFDSERIVQKAWDMAGEEIGFGRMGQHIYHTIGLNLGGRNEYFRSAIGEHFPGDVFADRARKAFKVLEEKSGVPLKPGVMKLLEYGKEKGLKMAVATSSRREYATRLLTNGNIYSYFEGYVFGDMVAHSKPEPEIFLKACEQIGVRAENSVALEDSPSGIRAAHAAGMYPVMIPDLVEPTGEIAALTYRIFHSLEEVIPMLNEMKKKESDSL